MATQKTWSYLQNPFLNSTKGSYKLAVRISTYHFNALKSNPGNSFDANLLGSYEPKHVALLNAYSQWTQQGGSQKGQTLNVNQLFEQLGGVKIRRWDGTIVNVHDKNTPAYVSILPNGRLPFANGTQTNKLNVLKALVAALNADSALTPVYTEVLSFYTQLKAALDAQKSNITSTKTNSDVVEAARVEMCVAQYANLGGHIQHYALTPQFINQYYDLVVVRSGAQILYTGSVKPGTTKNILKHTFAEGDKILLQNDGTTDLQFFMASLKTGTVGERAITVAAGAQLTVLTTDLGGIDATYLNVVNTNAQTAGDWTVEFV